jgi:hypothetical protein
VFEPDESGSPDLWEEMDQVASEHSAANLPGSAGMLARAALGRDERVVDDAVAYRELLAMTAYWNRADHYLTRAAIKRLLIPLWIIVGLLAFIVMRG